MTIRQTLPLKVRFIPKKQYPDINWRPGRLLNNVSESDLRVWKSDLGL